MCFVLFGCIWDCLVALLGAKRAARQNFSQQTQPIRPHWTLSSCFSAFRIIWVHWGPFGCVPTLSLKRVKLVQKFVTLTPQNFSQRTHPIHPNGPKTHIFVCFILF